MKSWRTIAFLASVFTCICGSLLLWPRAAMTQQQAQPSLTIEEYQPKSMLVVKEQKIERAKFPFIDIHSHHWEVTPEYVDKLVKEMDSINLQVLVNLSGGTGEHLKHTLAVMKGRYPDRFVVFANMSFDDLNTPGFGKRQAERLEQKGQERARGPENFQQFRIGLE